MIAYLDRRRTGALCLGIAVAFLVIGWWPFAPLPRNRVEWLAGRPGLGFRPPGIAYDAHPLPWSPGIGTTGFTIELQVEAGLEPRSGTPHLLTIHDGALPSRLVLCQWKSELILRVPDPANPRGYREAAAEVLPPHPRVITVTCSAAGTTFFADGRPVVRYPRFIVAHDALRGRLLLGDAANGKCAWTGKMFGVALINRALDAGEVAARHRAWVARETTVLRSERGLMALYLFEDGPGERTMDLAGAHHQLEIPARYEVPHQTMFEFPRDLGVMLRTDLRDSIVNLLGFVPFGFLVFHHRRLARPDHLLAAATFAVIAGGLLSLVIELGQVWLPTRVSSATDLILNTIGTGLGVLMAVGTKS